MTKAFLLILLLLTISGFGQTTEKAVATYSVNDKLIGLSNLYGGLSDCSIRSVAGKVKGVDLIGKTAEVTIRVDKKTKAKVLVPLDRVADRDRNAVFRHLITKNNIIRVAGYACTPDEPFSVFSVDRVY